MAQPLFSPVTPGAGSYSTTQVVVILCSVLAMCNAVELIVLVFTTFRRYQGLYFWSLLVASAGVVPYNIGFLLEFFVIGPGFVGVIVDVPGWMAMVTGQSLVLYSRLHLVLQNRGVLRAVLGMIMVDGMVFHISTTIVRFAGYYGGEQTKFRAAWGVIEKVQMTGFCVQEFVISGLYLYETVQLLRVLEKKNALQTMWQLFAINVFIIGLDVGLLAVEYLDLTVYEQTFKGVVYSIKLKLEFAILGKLVKITRADGHAFVHADERLDAFGRTRRRSDACGGEVKKARSQADELRTSSVLSGLKEWDDRPEKDKRAIQHLDELH